jgi:hypothetical protein
VAHSLDTNFLEDALDLRMFYVRLVILSTVSRRLYLSSLM